MKQKPVKPPARSSVIGAVLAAVFGLCLWWMPVGEPWVNASYDYSFRFGVHPSPTTYR